ncbi:histamine N-methyltransferase [Amia ocellicauda]|uniref:histamine N-methyltransferase n=1 Tax=Amia ocellicauda TaxID=2972642 RepID=UPI0034642DFE|nr:HNMT methyltransferase [Amia calva]
MASLKKLVNNESRYLRSFQLFLDRSSEHQSMQKFINGTLPDILARIGDGKSSIDVMGVGSGGGKIDLQMLSQLQSKHPGVSITNEIVEPSGEMINNYKELVSKTPDLENINFTWHMMTSSEYELLRTEKNITTKMDFIHMIQMLYYESDPGARVKFFRSLLNQTGKLLLILGSGTSGWAKLRNTYKSELCDSNIGQYVTTYLNEYLDAEGITFQSYDLSSSIDITECFTVGDENGELLLDFLTQVSDFSKMAPEDLKAGVMDLLHHPECSKEIDGRIMFNSTMVVVVVGP